ncbi:hypothetical protein BDQ17DRAFT_1424972 [Cyathus striatus]|nr:hypothetical protein BDQ17DRAFT_1424972 [Cyathus striatus]
MSFLNAHLRRSLSVPKPFGRLNSKQRLCDVFSRTGTIPAGSTSSWASRITSTWIKPTSEFDVISERFRAPTSTNWVPAPRLKRYKRQSNLFFAVVSLSMFAAAAYMTNRDTARYLNESDVPPDKWWSLDNRKLRDAKERDIVDRIRKTADYHLQYLQSSFPSLQQTTKDILATGCAVYHHPLLFCISSPEWFIAILVIAPWSTFALGYIARLRPFLKRHMEHRIWAPYTLFTAMYNTRTFGQLAFTMYAAPIATVCGSAWFFHAPKLQAIHESTPTYHMAAFVYSAGMFSLLLSFYTRHMRYALSWRINTFFKTIHRLPYTLGTTFQPNIGFSGAIYACITLAAMEWRDEKTKFVFGSEALKFSCVWAAWVGVEVVLMLLGVGWGNWAAHLAGVLYGFGYQRWGVDGWVWLSALWEAGGGGWFDNNSCLPA